MHGLKYIALSAVAGLSFMATASRTSEAQISVNIGPAPACPYGYYDAAPYNCAPYGYYGPEWFTGGVFLGAGPWFHGPRDFRGHVDTRYHPDYGYHGGYPARNERPRAGWNGHPQNFHGQAMHDGHGFVGGGEHHH